MKEVVLKKKIYKPVFNLRAVCPRCRHEDIGILFVFDVFRDCLERTCFGCGYCWEESLRLVSESYKDEMKRIQKLISDIELQLSRESTNIVSCECEKIPWCVVRCLCEFKNRIMYLKEKL